MAVMVVAVMVMAVVLPVLEEALLSELFNPGIHTSLGEVCLVPLIKHQTNELAPASFGRSVIVAIHGGIPIHGGTRILDLVVELTCSITKVLSITILVTRTEYGHFLSLHVNVRKHIVHPLVPGGPGALFIRPRVVCGSTHDDGITVAEVPGEGIPLGILSDQSGGADSQGPAEVPGGDLRAPIAAAEVEAHTTLRVRLGTPVEPIRGGGRSRGRQRGHGHFIGVATVDGITVIMEAGNPDLISLGTQQFLSVGSAALMGDLVGIVVGAVVVHAAIPAVNGVLGIARILLIIGGVSLVEGVDVARHHALGGTAKVERRGVLTDHAVAQIPEGGIFHGMLSSHRAEERGGGREDHPAVPEAGLGGRGLGQGQRMRDGAKPAAFLENRVEVLVHAVSKHDDQVIHSHVEVHLDGRSVFELNEEATCRLVILLTRSEEKGQPLINVPIDRRIRLAGIARLLHLGSVVRMEVFEMITLVDHGLHVELVPALGGQDGRPPGVAAQTGRQRLRRSLHAGAEGGYCGTQAGAHPRVLGAGLELLRRAGQGAGADGDPPRAVVERELWRSHLLSVDARLQLAEHLGLV